MLLERTRVATPIRRIALALEYVDGKGRRRQLERRIRGPLGAGEIARVATRLGPYAGGDCPVTVIAARAVR